MKRSTAPNPKRARPRHLASPPHDREVDEICEAIRAGRCCTLIGPAHHQKTAMMLHATQVIEAWDGYATLYVSLWRVQAQSEAEFYNLLRRNLATKALRYYKVQLPSTPLHSANELKRFLLHIAETLRLNLVLFFDDLDAAPEYVRELLAILRASYQSSKPPIQVLAVVCSANSLARTAFGSTSPFEPISRRIRVRDLDANETQQRARELLRPYRVRVTARVLRAIHAQTNGDRFLVTQLTKMGAQRVRRARRRWLTLADLECAADRLIAHGSSGALAEGVRQFESDAKWCSAISRLADGHPLPISELVFDLRENPDPFTASGFVVNAQGLFRLKSALHQKFLKHYFTNEHIGRVLLAAGQWSEALDYLARDLKNDPTGARARVLLAAANAIYAASDLTTAYSFFVRGVALAYPHASIHLYVIAQEALVQVHPPVSPEDANSEKRIPLDTLTMEGRALAHAHAYWLQRHARERFDLYVPLRTASQTNLGLLVMEKFIQPKNFKRHQELLAEVESCTGHLARALQDRLEYHQLTHAAQRRADDLQHLLELMRDLMKQHDSFDQVLRNALHSAQQALGTRAQRGSIYLYNRKTGLLEMEVGLGYPLEIWRGRVFRPGEGIAGRVFQTGKLCNVPDTDTEPLYVHFPSDDDTPIHSAIGVPLIGKDVILGVLFLDNLVHTNAFDPESERVLELFGGQVALWLESTELLDRLNTRQRLSLLALGAAHEIKKPLDWAHKTAEDIKTFIEPEQWAPPLQNNVKRLLAQLVHSRQGLQWILNYAKLAAPRFERVDLAHLVRARLDALRGSIAARIDLHDPPPARVTPYAKVDPELIEMLIENMVENAVEAIGDQNAGAVSVQVTLEEASCLMHFRDTGPGIAPERRERIFELGESSKQSGKFGRGWGLYFCREVATAHDGSLKYDDQHTGKGAAFVLRLPRVEFPAIGETPA